MCASRHNASGMLGRCRQKGGSSKILGKPEVVTRNRPASSNQTRIQEERFPSQEEANKYRGRFRLNQSIYTKHFQSKTVIMHPLPRDSRMEANELDNDLNTNPNLAIFRQTDNGVLVRMALFALTLGVEDLVAKYERDVVWYTNKSQ